MSSNTTGNATDTVDASGFSFLFSASHVGTAMSLLGVVLNVTVLASIVAHWSSLMKRSSNIGLAIFVIVCVSILHGLLMATTDELWVATITQWIQDSFGPFDNTAGADALASLSYLLMTLLFAANFLLALERHWVIRFNVSLSRLAVCTIFASALLFSSFFFVAFALPSDAVSWTFLPLGKPCTWDSDNNVCTMTSMQTGFFIAGLLYFPLASLAVAAVYENTYFLVAEVFEKYDHESNRRTSRVLMEESIKVQKSALIRCVLMSIGLVVFYVPSIVLIFAGTANEALLVNFSANQPLLFSVTTLPSLDPLWSAIMILVFQVEFQEAYLASIRRVWARIRHSKT